MKAISQFYPYILAILLFSCGKNNENKDVDISNIQANSQINRLDKELFGLKTESDILAFLVKNKSIAIPYFDSPEANLPDLAIKLHEFLKNPDLANFYKNSIDSKVGIEVDSIESALNLAFRHIKYYYPKFNPPKIYTLFTGFAGKDLWVTDSVIVIGLDYFVGKNAKYRPQVYEYQLKKYQNEYIVPTILNLLAIRFANVNPADKTMLADMVFYGKCQQFTKMMIPKAADSLIIYYSQKQLEETGISQEMIWGHIIDEKLLFENSPFKKAKYLDERPNTQEISPDCPGQIGRWLGWKIIKKFVENNSGITFQMLMNDPSAQHILEKSKYKGKPDESE